MSSTLVAIEALLRADTQIDPETKKKILRACNPKPPKRRLGTIRDACLILGVKPITIRRYKAKGLISAVYINARRVRYDLDQIEELANYGVPAQSK